MGGRGRCRFYGYSVWDWHGLGGVFGARLESPYSVGSSNLDCLKVMRIAEDDQYDDVDAIARVLSN